MTPHIQEVTEDGFESTSNAHPSGLGFTSSAASGDSADFDDNTSVNGDAP